MLNEFLGRSTHYKKGFTSAIEALYGSPCMLPVSCIIGIQRKHMLAAGHGQINFCQYLGIE